MMCEHFPCDLRSVMSLRQAMNHGVQCTDNRFWTGTYKFPQWKKIYLERIVLPHVCQIHHQSWHEVCRSRHKNNYTERAQSYHQSRHWSDWVKKKQTFLHHYNWKTLSRSFWHKGTQTQWHTRVEQTIGLSVMMLYIRMPNGAVAQQFSQMLYKVPQSCLKCANPSFKKSNHEFI